MWSVVLMEFTLGRGGNQKRDASRFHTNFLVCLFAVTFLWVVFGGGGVFDYLYNIAKYWKISFPKTVNFFALSMLIRGLT